jgi:hypothetical protein
MKTKKKRKKFDKIARQQAPAPVKATRRMSDSRLMAMLDYHMQESISEIANAYQLLASSLGFRKANFEPRIVSSSPDPNKKIDLAFDCAASIADWRKQCESKSMDARAVMLVVADGCSISGIMRETGWTREHAGHQLRGCLTVWSLSRQRVQSIEVSKHQQAIKASERTK